jgi:hypothetical protein
MKKISVVFLCLLLLAPAGFPAEMFDWLKQPYVEHPIAPVDLSNSPRIRQLLRSGNIYLSLSDASRWPSKTISTFNSSATPCRRRIPSCCAPKAAGCCEG